MIIRTTKVYDKWFGKLRNEIAKATIVRKIELMANGIDFKDQKPVGDDIYELRVHHGAGYRVYYTVQGKEITILLCGGDKDSQQKDIAKELAKGV